MSKELRRLNRSQLIEIIYELEKQDEQYLEEIETLRSQLESREIKISSSGSIAEAAMQLNGIFESAQAAAEQFLQSVRSAADHEKEKLIAEAKEKAAEILADAERKSAAILNQTLNVQNKETE